MNTKEQRRIGFLIGAVVLVFLGAYYAARAPREKPREVISNLDTNSITIPIEGMTCASCVAQVKQKLRSMDGVSEVEVSLEHRQAQVRYVKARVSEEQLKVAINKLGYKAGTPTTENGR